MILSKKKPLQNMSSKARDINASIYFKYHCELYPIERVWGKAKQCTRSHCDYSFASLQKTIDPVLNSVSTDTLRKYFRKASEYMKANREGVTDKVIVVEALKIM